MTRHHLFSCATLAIAIAFATGQARAVLVLYEPFDYAESNFLSATTVGTTNGTTSPIGYLAPNFNNWYGTGIAAATGYQVANDGQIIATDLSVSGLAKPGSTRSLTLGGTGHTFRLSLNTSTSGSPNQTTTNAMDTADPLAGTDDTLQPSDTAGTGYYSIAFQVTDITSLNVSGGVMLGFNNVANAQVGNPTTVGAALSIRPKAGGGATEFELGIADQGTASFAAATWDTTHTYTTNSTIFVVGKYQTVGAIFPGGTPATTDDLAMLWINPSSSTFGGFEPAGALTNDFTNNDIPTNSTTNNHTLQTFVLRQTGATVNNQVPAGVIYDELRVGTTWADVTPLPAPASVDGDYNGNGKVDAADYVLWREGVQPLPHNEVATIGTTDAQDYTEWKARFGNTSGSGTATAVPESGTLLLALSGLRISLLRRDRFIEFRR